MPITQTSSGFAPEIRDVTEAASGVCLGTFLPTISAIKGWTWSTIAAQALPWG